MKNQQEINSNYRREPVDVATFFELGWKKKNEDSLEGRKQKLQKIFCHSHQRLEELSKSEFKIAEYITIFNFTMDSHIP